MPSLNAVAQPFINEAEEKMKKSVNKIRQEYASLRGPYLGFKLILDRIVHGWFYKQ